MFRKIFMNRRRAADRRRDEDPCKDLPLDIYHRKRRKSVDRRSPNRSLEQDYFAYMADDKDPPSSH